jgi:hypothetical protein
MPKPLAAAVLVAAGVRSGAADGATHTADLGS